MSDDMPEVGEDWFKKAKLRIPPDYEPPIEISPRRMTTGQQVRAFLVFAAGMALLTALFYMTGAGHCQHPQLNTINHVPLDKQFK